MQEPRERALAREYLAALRHRRQLSGGTSGKYARAIELLFQHVKNDRLEDLQSARVRRFVAMLHAKGLAPRTLALTLSAWRGWFRWLARQHGWRANPVLGIRAPKAGRPLPKVLSVDTAGKLLDGATAAETAGEPALLRDRAMFELLYSSGLRP